MEVLGVQITSDDRLVFPDAGCTKGDVARYYARMSERMLDLAGNRPVALLRCPEGRNGDCFFQKHAGKGFPQTIGTFTIRERSGRSEPYMVIREAAGFVAAAQMGAVEFHVWGSRADRLEWPDRLVFDLDPDESLSFGDVKAAAGELRLLLEELGFDSTPMVTGGKGLHVIVSLPPRADWGMVAAFAKRVAVCMAEEHPDRFVATMAKAKRQGRIFIDWLRNERGNTAIAPYSIRARSGAPVAVPVTWEELPGLGSAKAFHIPDATARLAVPCPLARLSAERPVSAEVMDRLEDIRRR